MAADFALRLASAIWASRSAVPALARTSPLVTRSPTLTVTSVTGHATELAALFDELEELAAAVVVVGAAPKPRSYVKLAATEPVAVTSSVTSAVVAAAVRKVVAEADWGRSSPVETATADPATASRTTMARTFQRM